MTISELYKIYKKHGVITTDSRDCTEGSIFFALKGGSFDGNKFALASLEKGCSYAVVDDKSMFTDSKDERIILVDDVLQTFKDLAREHRRQFDIPIIGITGTNGKTTTKELIAAVLATKYNVMFTLGNFNNDIGVPKTLFRLAAEHEIAVVEMGASHPGDIRTLMETVEPTCGLITNVGRAHLQGFGSFDGVKRTKGELYDNLANRKKIAFLNTADEDLSQMTSERDLAIMPYVNGSVESCSPFINIALEDGLKIKTHLIGSYNLANILAAVTIGRYFGVKDDQIVKALYDYQPSNNRSQLMVTEKNNLVVDAYNANPTSMAAAIENFKQMDVKEKKVAILGEMLELGEVSQVEHQKIADLLLESGFDTIWLVGEEFENTNTSYPVFKDVETVKGAITDANLQDCYILIKGSNGTKLFQLPEYL